MIATQQQQEMSHSSNNAHPRQVSQQQEPVVVGRYDNGYGDEHSDGDDNEGDFYSEYDDFTVSCTGHQKPGRGGRSSKSNQNSDTGVYSSKHVRARTANGKAGQQRRK